MIEKRSIEEFTEDEFDLEVRKSVNLAKAMAINNAKYGDGFIFDTCGSIVGYVSKIGFIENEKRKDDKNDNAKRKRK